jgi:hypothetical protein
MQCFLLLHLFGHSVQWVAPSVEHTLADLQHTEDRDHFMQVLRAYELEAAGFGMQLMTRSASGHSTNGSAILSRPIGATSSATTRRRDFPTGSRASSAAAHW